MAHLLYPLAVLACPIGMGAMMFFMMRGSKQGSSSQQPGGSDELTRLRAEVDQLRAAQLDDRRTAPTESERWDQG